MPHISTFFCPSNSGTGHSTTPIPINNVLIFQYLECQVKQKTIKPPNTYQTQSLRKLQVVYVYIATYLDPEAADVAFPPPGFLTFLDFILQFVRHVLP